MTDPQLMVDLQTSPPMAAVGLTPPESITPGSRQAGAYRHRIPVETQRHRRMVQTADA